jgi:hypothetical protein
MQELLIALITLTTPGFAFLAYRHTDIAKRLIVYSLFGILAIFAAYAWAFDWTFDGYQKGADIAVEKTNQLQKVIDTIAVHKNDTSGMWKEDKGLLILMTQVKATLMMSIVKDIKSETQKEADEFYKYRRIMLIWVGILAALALFSELWEKYQLKKKVNTKSIQAAPEESD